MPPRRTTRTEKKEATRERLLAAAERIAAKEGFGRITLDRVAEAAGLTKGAVYSNFASKEEFLLEVSTRLTPSLSIIGEIVDMPDLRSLMQYVGQRISDVAETRPKEAVLSLEFVAVVLRDRKLKRAMRAEQDAARSEQDATDPTGGWFDAHREQFPIPPEQFTTAVNAVAWGLLEHRLLYGAEAMPDELIQWTLSRLLLAD